MKVEHCIGCADDDCLPCIREERTKLRAENERLLTICSRYRDKLNRIIGEKLTLIERIAAVKAAGLEYCAALQAMVERGNVNDSERLTAAEERFDSLFAMSTPSTDAGGPVDETEER